MREVVQVDPRRRADVLDVTDGVVEWLEQRLPDDSSRVVLPRVVLTPVDVLELRAHLLPELALGVVGHPTGVDDEAGELGRVLRQPVRAEQEDGEDDEDDELPPVGQHQSSLAASRVMDSWRSEPSRSIVRRTVSPTSFARIRTTS